MTRAYGLNSDVLLGFDFMDLYQTVLDVGQKRVTEQGHPVPVTIQGWQSKLDKHRHGPNPVIVAETTVIQTNSGTDTLHVKATRDIPAALQSRLFEFVPATTESDLTHIAVGVVNGQQQTFSLRFANLSNAPISQKLG